MVMIKGIVMNSDVVKNKFYLKVITCNNNNRMKMLQVKYRKKKIKNKNRKRNLELVKDYLMQQLKK